MIYLLNFNEEFYMNTFILYGPLPTMIIASFLSFSLSSLFMMWFLMEISNFMFTLFLLTSTKEKKIIFMFFLIQMITSLMMMLAMIFNPSLYPELSKLMMFASLLTKLAAPPFHLWMPAMAKYITWRSIFLISTIQKIIPLNILNLVNLNNFMMIFIILSSTILPTVMMLNTKNLKKFLIYSSINQSGWILSMIFLKNSFWVFYLMFYSFVMLVSCSILNFTKASNLNLSFLAKKSNLLFVIIMMNIASLPPFSFFVYKWLSTFILTFNTNLSFLITFMLFNSLILTFMYTKMISSSLFPLSFNSKIMILNKKMTINKTLFMILSFTSPILLI